MYRGCLRIRAMTEDEMLENRRIFNSVFYVKSGTLIYVPGEMNF